MIGMIARELREVWIIFSLVLFREGKCPSYAPALITIY